MGKFVCALCLYSRFRNMLAYAINCEYTRGVMLLELNLQNLIYCYLIGYSKSCDYQLYCSAFSHPQFVLPMAS